ncbi:hypothetical protein T03_1477 [Trichinella britovi]|uniref:Uncharacterized protein n=1 Tax=Trichinella britovi TaxID=45882 RepID=A0A0V1D0D4_TRIBR|nr:hypothetical protein T03_1477 [Trichinella britovi]
MLAGRMEVNKIRHTGSLQLPQDKDNQISFVLNRGSEVAEESNREIESRAECWCDSCETQAVVGDYQITNLSLLLNPIKSSLPKESSQPYTVH